MLRSHHQTASHPANFKSRFSSNPFGNVVVVLQNIARLLFLNAFARSVDARTRRGFGVDQHYPGLSSDKRKRLGIDPEVPIR